MASSANSEPVGGDAEEVDAVVVGEVRRLPGRRSTGEIVATQAAVVGGSLVVGAVAAAVVARRRRGSGGRRVGRGRRQQVAASRSFLVDVHMLGR